MMKRALLGIIIIFSLLWLGALMSSLQREQDSAYGSMCELLQLDTNQRSAREIAK